MKKSLNIHWAIRWQLDHKNLKENPYTKQLIKFICKEAAGHNYPKNNRMPSMADLAEYLQIPINNVERAYNFLIENNEVLYSASTKGTYMHDTHRNESSVTEYVLPVYDRKANIYNDEDHVLWNTLTLGASFPCTTMSMLEKVVQHGKKVKNPLEPGQHIQSVAHRMLNRKNIPHNLDQLSVVPRGAAVYKVLRNLVPPGSKIVCGSNSDHFMADIFNYLGLEVLIAGEDEEGMRIETLKHLCQNNDVKAVFLRVTSDFPMPGVLTKKRWQEILDLAKEQQFWILLLDENYEFSKAAPLDIDVNIGLIIYIFPFSKLNIYFSDIGIVVAPPHVTNILKNKTDRFFVGWDSVIEHITADLHADHIIHNEILKVILKIKKGIYKLGQIFKNYLEGIAKLIIAKAGLFAFIEFKNPINPIIIEMIRRTGLYRKEENAALMNDRPINVFRISLCTDNWHEIENIFKMIKEEMYCDCALPMVSLPNTPLMGP